MATQVLELLAECRAQLKGAIEPVESTEWATIDFWASEWRPWIRRAFPSELEDFERLVAKPEFTSAPRAPRFDRSRLLYSREHELEAQAYYQQRGAETASANRELASKRKQSLLRFIDGLERLHKSLLDTPSEVEQLIANYSPMTMSPGEPIGVFLSYSHQDRDEMLALDEHFSALKRQNLVKSWHDGRIAPGEDWSAEIRKNLELSRVTVLLISSSFLASEYCYSIEMRSALERREKGEVIVVPVIVRPCDWKGSPFASIQMLPTGANPITSWANRDAARADVAKGIRVIIEKIAAGIP